MRTSIALGSALLSVTLLSCHRPPREVAPKPISPAGTREPVRPEESAAFQRIVEGCARQELDRFTHYRCELTPPGHFPNVLPATGSASDECPSGYRLAKQECGKPMIFSDGRSTEITGTCISAELCPAGGKSVIEFAFRSTDYPSLHISCYHRVGMKGDHIYEISPAGRVRGRMSMREGTEFQQVCDWSEGSGWISREARFLNGYYQGLVFLFYDTGTLREAECYDIGKRTGAISRWDEEGRPYILEPTDQKGVQRRRLIDKPQE